MTDDRVLPWEDATAFYAERDDRTARGIPALDAYTRRPVELWIDPDRAEDPTVQRVALVAANLTARWARKVSVIVPPKTRLVDPLRRDGHSLLTDRLLGEMRNADPFGDFAVGEARLQPSSEVGHVPANPMTPRPRRLLIGPWEAGQPPGSPVEDGDYQVHAVSWTALGRRLTSGDSGALSTHDHLGRHEPASVAAVGLAGALGVADLFKRAIGHERHHWMPTFGWDTWSNRLTQGQDAWNSVQVHEPVLGFDWGRTLLAGAGAIGSAIVYLADLVPQKGDLTILDRDWVETSNLNRSPLFTVRHAANKMLKTEALAEFLAGRSVRVTSLTGVWRDHVDSLASEPFDVWISLTNEDGAWAELPFALPPLVLHGTTTSGWGAGAGRHVPRREDCTLCRMPRPAAPFRGPCAEGQVAPAAESEPVRAALPFLSVVAAALAVALHLQLQLGVSPAQSVNDVSVDLSAGLPWVGALRRGPTKGCRGCAAATTDAWRRFGGQGRFACYSDV